MRCAYRAPAERLVRQCCVLKSIFILPIMVHLTYIFFRNYLSFYYIVQFAGVILAQRNQTASGSQGLTGGNIIRLPFFYLPLLYKKYIPSPTANVRAS